MANDEHVELLRKSVDAWNDWRAQNPDMEVDLDGADLQGANLSGANLSGAHLFRADLSWKRLIGVDLSGALLIGANLSQADLSQTPLIGADLRDEVETSHSRGQTRVAGTQALTDLTPCSQALQSIKWPEERSGL
jgi:uncharacterized protein YjbI with pentapeptide repeats